MGIAISQIFASLEPCFYARSTVRMALRKLAEKHSSSDEFKREKLHSFYPRGTHFTPTDPKVGTS